MRIRLGVPKGLNRDETAAMLDAALESVTRANEPLIARGNIPPFEHALKAGRVRWRPEPPGDEHFDLPSTVLKRGWGDCDDLAPWHAASLRASGEDPEARAIVRPSGPNRWHAIVERHNGQIQDPSKAAGMGVVGGDEYTGPFWPPMFDRLSLAASPLQRGWGARVDIPDASWPLFNWSNVARGYNPASAVIGAIQCGMHVCGDDMSPQDAQRLAVLHDLICGCTTDEVAEGLAQVYGGESVGFLPMLAAALPAAASLASPLLSAVPGLGNLFGGGAKAPAAAPAAPAAPMPAMAAPSFSPGGGAPSGATVSIPGGPIIVRF